MEENKQTDKTEELSEELWEEEQDIEEIVLKYQQKETEEQGEGNTIRDKVYGRLPFTVRQMDIFIAILVLVIIVLLIYSAMTAGR